MEIYGIEDPYPKLYINNNNIKNSTQACSYVHSNENIIYEHLPSKIYKIKKVKMINLMKHKIMNLVKLKK